jgi:hypothetical protein
VQAISDPNVKFGKFDAAFETRRECFDDASAQDGLSAGNHNADADGCSDQKQHQNSGNPAPTPRVSTGRHGDDPGTAFFDWR